MTTKFYLLVIEGDVCAELQGPYISRARLDYAEKFWAERHHLKVASKAGILGIPGNLGLAEYIMNLEARLETIQERLDALENATQPVVRRY